MATGHIAAHRLAFHKRGIDGSAKADAVYTGRASDCVWGVLFSLSREHKPILDGYELGYDAREVVVIGNHGVVSAFTYVARAEAIDGKLKPFSWYHRLVIHGATQHRLPLNYVQHLRAVESVADPDDVRRHHNSRLLGT
jgi:hypothetical protein